MGLGVVIATAIFLAFASLMRLQPVSLPAVTGPYPVGRTEIALTDTSRSDPFATDGRARELAVWIWYPAIAGSSETPAPYLPAAWAPLVNDVPLSQDLTAVSTNSVANASLQGRPPVVILQPGLSLPVASYTTLAEDLASHGYAVVGINATGSAPAVFPDGHVVPAMAQGNVSGATVDAWYSSAERVASVWADDAEFVVQSLGDLPPAVGELDLSHVAYVGHSMGGASAYQACSEDPDCAAAVDLDGTLWTDVRHAGLSAPHLLLQKAAAQECDEFCRRAAADFANVMDRADAERFNVAGATHMNFSDAGLMFGIANGIVLGPIDDERMTAIERDVVRAFLDVHVLGAQPDEFSATTARYDELIPTK